MCILYVILAYFILMFVGSNLIGVIVRGFVSYTGENLLSFQSILITSIFIIIAFVYYYILFHYFNYGFAIAGAMLMFPRIPDLLFEMETGTKVTAKNSPKGILSLLCTALLWGAIPVLIYFICYYN
jgi:hypothetical protein